MSDFEIDARVELAPGYDHLYNPDLSTGRLVGAFVEAKAYVRARKEDEVGFPQVYIEWDKEDWRYAGMPDGWTFENHFRPVKKAEGEEPKAQPDLLSEMITNAISRNDTCEHCGHSEDEEMAEDFIETLQNVEEAILESDGFIVITVAGEPSEMPGYLKFDAHLLHAEMTPEAREALEEHILHIAAHLILNRGQM